MRFLLLTLLLFLLLVPSLSFATEAGDDFDASLSDSIFDPSSDSLNVIKNLFVDRYNSFAEEIKTTSVVSVVSWDVSGIQSSSSSLTFDFGRYGQHTFDYADWPDSIFIVIRSLILFACAFYSIRIIARG